MNSKNRRGGLGRGLGSLIPTAPPPEAAPGPADLPRAGFATGTSTLAGAPDRPADDPTDDLDLESPLAAVPGASFAELPVDQIHPNAKQPRQVFDEDALAELTHSIREFGVLQPVVVRAADDGYELVMGERRLRAAQAAGLRTIPAIVRSTGDDAMLRDALLENIHRAQLNPLEEAAAYQQLLEEFGTTHEELARRIGRSRPQVSNTIRLMNLPLAVQRRVAAGVLSAGHARALLSLDDADQQDELAGGGVARRRGRRPGGRPGGRGGGGGPRGGGGGGARRGGPGGGGEEEGPGGRAGAPDPRPRRDRVGEQALGRVRHPGAGRHRPAQ